MLKYHINDYIGKRYGHLIVIGKTENSSIPNAFDFKCDCGKIVSYAPDRVISGRQKSCGKCVFSNKPSYPRFDIAEYIGKKKNKLTVVGLADKSPADKKWYIKCVCDCGNTVEVLPYQFEKGIIKSCGCLRKNSPNYKDGRTKHSLYSLWKTMIDRCENPEHHKYKQYGLRGIKVCSEWHDFWCFVRWSDSIGGRPQGYTLDRINNNGNYEPSNCRWATSKQQSHNRTSNKIIEYNGVSKPLCEWANDLGIKPKTLASRLAKGWDIEKALNPIHYFGNQYNSNRSD